MTDRTFSALARRRARRIRRDRIAEMHEHSRKYRP